MGIVYLKNRDFELMFTIPWKTNLRKRILSEFRGIFAVLFAFFGDGRYNNFVVVWFRMEEREQI